jgi:cell division protein FtsW
MATLKRVIKRLLSPGANEHEPDKNLIFSVSIIVIFGLIMMSSASAVVSYAKFGNSYYFLKNQLIGLVVGLIAFYFTSKIDYHLWRRFALGFLLFSIFLLLLVFIPGLAADYGSARSWINVFGFSLQPSEFVKLSFLIYLAAWLESRGKRISDFHEGSGPFVIVLGVIGFLMILQPDIGTLLIITLISMAVYFVGGGRLYHIIVMILIGIIGLFLMVQVKDYQADRFRCFLDPSFSRQDKCYQINQSLIAVGSGGFFGRGLGESRQKYMYIPEIQGDSIFAIIAEESGFIFSSILIILYVYVFYRGYLIAKHAPDVFGRILAIGIVSWIVVQAFLNIGGMINVVPMTGVPLPLVSYGGSAITAALAAVGILVNISKQTKVGR